MFWGCVKSCQTPREWALLGAEPLLQKQALDRVQWPGVHPRTATLTHTVGCTTTRAHHKSATCKQTLLTPNGATAFGR